ncbi:Phthiocerol synthesis polyketide synthase type I PpsD [Durusdinium trenchii]|uniref:Phthiocerol synthesis polyketide synthase type I PpsD n=1 Tax=Durusdinium trenchii TaxID=1381693 RepID=A0ABP0R0R7_9DINO
MPCGCLRGPRVQDEPSDGASSGAAAGSSVPPQQQMAAEAKAEPSGAPSGAKGLPYRLVRGKWENVRKLRITHASAEAPINLKQVEIYGCDGVNYALATNGGTAVLSSEMGDGETWGPAKFVIDGVREGCVCHSAHEENGWLEVILAKPTNVESFAIFNMPDDEHGHRMRIEGHGVELVSNSEEVIFKHTVSATVDIALFDQDQGCRQRWINEDAMPVRASVSLGKDPKDSKAKVFSVKPSGEILAELSIRLDATPAMLCEQISGLTNIESYRLRLILADTQVLRLTGQQEPLQSYLGQASNGNDNGNEIRNDDGEEDDLLANPALMELPFRLVRGASWENVKRLRISTPSAEAPVHLRQVEIYGCDGINYALASNGGVAVTSSEQGDGETWGPAKLVIDGLREGGVCHTAHEEGGFLEVFLPKAMDVESFAIFNMCDDEWDHRMRLEGHLVELLNESGLVLWSQTVSSEEDVGLFDQARSCRQRWINEDFLSLKAHLSLGLDPEIVGMVKAFAVRTGGRLLAACSLGLDLTVAALCEQIAGLTNIEAHRFRLMLADGRILRLSGGDVPLRSLLPEAKEGEAPPVEAVDNGNGNEV